jgi:DNA repair photolyase
MPFEWSLNPYTGCAHRCTFCYVRAFERRADRPSDERYGAVVRVKSNVAEVLRLELARPSWRREAVAIGAATDPYQPAEGRFRLTRACIEAFSSARNPFSIITRGPLIVRDIDVLARAAERAEVSIHVSVPTLDEAVWRSTEPGTAPPHARLAAIRRLVDAGIRTTVLMAPILPGLSDHPRQLAAVIRAAREAGATSVSAFHLHLRPGTREHFLAELARHWPRERRRYDALYARGAYLGADETRPLREIVGRLRQEIGIGDRRRVRLEPPPQPRQLELEIA